MPRNSRANTEQDVLGSSFDSEFGLLQVEQMFKKNGQMIVPDSDNPLPSEDIKYAVKITESGDITYIAQAQPGADQSEAVWRVQKVDTTTGVVITWADGNTNFDNIATDLTVLSYS